MDQAQPAFTKTIQDCRKQYQRLVEPHRPDLWRHCRWLTGDPWDAEDLVQDTLLRAFASLSRRYFDLPPMRPWLLRIATNRWIDLCRARRETLDADGARDAAEAPAAVDPVEFGEAAEILLALPPRERAVVALVDGLGLAAAEAAACIDSNEGAVRAALHRGRARLAARTTPATAGTHKPPAAAVDRAVVDSFCRAFNAGDLEALRTLLLPHARADVIGLVLEDSRDEIMDGSLPHTLAPVRPQARLVEIDGEAMLALSVRGDDGRDLLQEILRFTTSAGQIAAFRYYYFCPEVLREVSARLGLTAKHNGYWFH